MHQPNNHPIVLINLVNKNKTPFSILCCSIDTFVTTKFTSELLHQIAVTITK